jgi:predicted RNA-binding Zn-ribbon protein involved in translation (DUF1610 family)
MNGRSIGTVDRSAPRICDDGPVTDVVTAEDQKQFDCPRCGQAATARFYGPCDTCRHDLRANLGNEQHELEKVEFEPKMNVVPNHVATKE